VSAPLVWELPETSPRRSLCATALSRRIVGAKIVTNAVIASTTIRFLMPITTVLFDADGVVQGPSANRRTMWAELLCGREHDIDRLVRDLFDLERTCYNGQGDFVAALPDLLLRWNCRGTVDDLLRAWTAIDVDAEVVRLITAIRSSGVTCCLATNQEPFRGRYMAEVLDYGGVFDRQFYSWEIGFSKPDPNYFREILERLSVSPEHVLFIDDIEPNVRAAESVGIQAKTFVPPSGTRATDEMLRLLRHYGLANPA
jgi:putative hydrolase of the HAD superfamily